MDIYLGIVRDVTREEFAFLQLHDYARHLVGKGHLHRRRRGCYAFRTSPEEITLRETFGCALVCLQFKGIVLHIVHRPRIGVIGINVVLPIIPVDMALRCPRRAVVGKLLVIHLIATNLQSLVSLCNVDTNLVVVFETGLCSTGGVRVYELQLNLALFWYIGLLLLCLVTAAGCHHQCPYSYHPNLFHIYIAFYFFTFHFSLST